MARDVSTQIKLYVWIATCALLSMFGDLACR